MEEKLGRGLAALLGEDVFGAEKGSSIHKVNIDLLDSNPNQPRKLFGQDKLNELSDSIAFHGILQPIVVRKKGDRYEIIAGERRWKAAKLANLGMVPIHVVDCADSDLLALSLIENIQRDDLNPIEEAEAIQQLITDCACTQEELGTILGKSRSHISNMLRLLYLPNEIQDLVRIGRLTAGHAKCLVGIENAVAVAQLVIDRMLNVRQLENMLKINRASIDKANEAPVKRTEIATNSDCEATDIANRIFEAIKIETKLKITRKGGVLTLTCKSCEELEELIEKLMSLSITSEKM
jgi:ParB family chromosome partitioning protein